jgi:hypothetical protein
VQILHNTLDTINNIHTIYEPLKHAILQHIKGRLYVHIISIVICRTGNFHTITFAEIAPLVSFNENPPDALTYKTLQTQAQSITMILHIHAHEWLTNLKGLEKTPHTTHD